MLPFVRKSSDLGPMTLLLGTLPLLNIQLLFSQLGSFCWLFDIRSFLLKHNILHCLTLFQELPYLCTFFFVGERFNMLLQYTTSPHPPFKAAWLLTVISGQ